MIRRECEVCGGPYSVFPSRAKRTKCCSRACANKAASRRAVASRPGVEARFWAQAEKRGPDECWPWTGATHGNGYGRIRAGRRVRPAHQVAWEIENGKPFPPGAYGCHRCDNPICVNPAHIWPGTHSENIQDAVRKGRFSNRIKPGNVCRSGHQLTAETIIIQAGRPRCLVCQRRYWANGNQARARTGIAA